MIPIHKYPRTQHIEGSRLQPGDEDITSVPFDAIKGLYLVVEEKIDGANCAVSFDSNGELLLQSRGHYLIGGPREKHFNLLKRWGQTHSHAFQEILGARFVMFGEWVYAKHTVFYDALPHYFMEFDIYDREKQIYLDTPSRRQMLKTLPVASVPVLSAGNFQSLKELTSLIGPSNYIREGHLERMSEYCRQQGIDVDTAWKETEPRITMEGLYIKAESGGAVVNRYKFVRSEFLQRALSSGSHWLARPIIPNQLAYDIDDLFLPQLPKHEGPNPEPGLAIGASAPPKQPAPDGR